MSRKEHRKEDNNPTKDSRNDQKNPLLKRPTLERPELRGLRYANLLRCSTLGQADTSPEGQKQFNDAFATMNQMLHVTDVLAEGVSGSQTFNRRDLRHLLEVHQSNPLDAVLVFDLSRLTRGGIRHGNVVEDELRKAGIRLISTTDLIPDGPEGELIKAVKHYANQLQARSISLSVARGLAQSLAREDRPAAGNAPYGLDRLYVGPGGEQRMLIRWDGLTQYWLNPQTLEVVGTRVRPEQPRRKKRTNPGAGGRRKQPFKGYIKQADETSLLVPGAKEKLEVLIWMFSAHYLKGLGYHLITQQLNDKSIPSPLGTRWCMKSVRDILYNPIYLGVEVRHRWSGALYNKLGPQGPVPVEVDQDKLEAEGRKGVPRVERPREEWELVDKEHLKNLLPSPLREIAAERMMARYDPEAPLHPRKGVALHTGEAARHRHHHSPFLLTNLLHSRQSGNPMRGEVVHRKLRSGPKTYRYYFDGVSSIYGEKGLLIRRVEAEPLEQAVMEALQQVVTGALEDGGRALARQVQAVVMRQVAAQVPDAGRKEALLAEQEEVGQRMRQVYRLGKQAAEALVEELAADAQRLGRITAELKRLEKQKTQAPADPQAVAVRVLARMRHLRQELGHLPNKEVKEVLAAMVQNLQVDLQTKEISFSLVVPPAMMASGAEKGADPAGDCEVDDVVRLDSGLAWWSPAEANRHDPQLKVLLDLWTCVAPQRGGRGSRRNSRCYACNREKKRAA